MRTKLFSLSLALALLLTACDGGPRTAPQAPETAVVATTYPMYLLAAAVLGEGGGMGLQLLIAQEVSCLHDYTLTTNDMRLLEGADLILKNGAGLEDFLPDVAAEIVDCSAGVELLACDHDHDHDHGDDPHIWLDPDRAAVMAGNIAQSLSALDPDNAEAYAANALVAAEALRAMRDEAREALENLRYRELVVFHDGFGYLADALDLTVLCSVETEEGGAPSARELAEIIQTVQAHGLPAVFTEVYGADGAAHAIARETGAAVYPLTMMMSKPETSEGEGIAAYRALFFQNVDTLKEALS